MKTHILYKYMSLVALFVLSALGMNAQEAFYIYRNDGKFNGFFYEEVQSIEYSKIDLEGIEHPEYVVEEILTEDSLYRIPLAVIDSVSFVQPEIIYNVKLRRMDEEGMMNYFLSADGLKLTFSNEMPAILRPRKDDVIVSFDFEKFEDGFGGRVSSTDSDAAGNFVVYCDSLHDVSDVFEQLILVEDIVADDEGNLVKVRGPHRIEGRKEGNLFSFNLNLHADFPRTEKFLITGGVNVGGGISCTSVYKITRSETFMECTLKSEFNLNFNLGFDLTLGDTEPMKCCETDLPNARFPSFLPIFKAGVKCAFFLRAQAHFAGSISYGPIKKVVAYTFSYNSETDQFDGGAADEDTGGYTAEEAKFNASVELNGTVHMGIYFSPNVGTISFFGSHAGVKLDCFLGPKLTGNLTLDAGSALDWDLYNTVKDSKVSISLLSFDYEFKGVRKFWNSAQKEVTFFDGSFSFMNFDWYIFPEFSEPKTETFFSDKKAKISTMPSRDILFALKLGIGLYDFKHNLLKKIYRTDRKYGEKSDNPDDGTYYASVDTEFKDLEINQPYIAAPLIELWGKDLPATPVDTFKLGATIDIKDVHVMSATYRPDGYTDPNQDNKKFSFRYKLSVKAVIDELESVDKWGYVYVTPSGKRLAIPADVEGKEFLDEKHSFYLDVPEEEVEIYGWVKYKNDSKLYYMEPKKFKITYPEEISIKITGCTFDETISDVTYEDTKYKYMTVFKVNFDCTGAGWLNVKTKESGKGWSDWENIDPNSTYPADGANVLTVYYYYDEKAFDGEFRVYLEGVGRWSGKEDKHVVTDDYIQLTNNGKKFTGCVLKTGTPEVPQSQVRRMMQKGGDGTHAIVIRKAQKK